MTTAPWAFKPFTIPEAITAADAVAKRDAARDICDPDGAWHTWCLVHLPEYDRKGIYKKFVATYLVAQVHAEMDR